MTRRSTNIIGVATLCFVSCVSLGRAQEQTSASPTDQEKLLKIAEEVRKQIVTLPQYGVFDNIHFGINPDGTVVLRGEASRPTLKSGAENVVKKIEGVEKVDNQIEVLPTSPNDDRIRAAVYAAIYSSAPLQKYTANRSSRPMPSVARAAGGITNDPPLGYHAIHIIVKNGNVTLTGVVNNESDMAIAGIRASGSAPCLQRRQPAPSGERIEVASELGLDRINRCPRPRNKHINMTPTTSSAR